MGHLLLIDDDSAVIPGQVRQAFPAPAHRVEVTATGAEGLERVGAGPPDVILLDLGLPDQSGLEVYQHIRRLDARIPVIFITMAKGADAAITRRVPSRAFTGADRKRIGKLEQVSGGTLFLDEVGDMPLALQAKVLRVLQEQSFERVGGNETIRTDVRLIAATHRDLKTWSEQGKFRPDLYYRLNVFAIHLPPLRERGDDLAVLVRHLLRRFSRELGREVQEVAPEALARLRAYSWPGTIRELQSVLKQALLQACGTTLLPASLPALPEEPGGPQPGCRPQ